MDLTLEQLLASLSNGLDKSASDKEDDKEDKDEKEDDKPAFLKKKEDNSEKEEDESDDEESDGQVKEASAQGAALAREIMEKVAGLNLESVTGMQKTASSAGKTLAQALIQKLASAGDMVTENGIPEGVVPNKNQVDNAQMKAEDDAKVKPMPTSDGLRPTGTINEIFDAIVADAMSQGAASTDQVHGTGVAAQEGAVEDHALPNQVKAAAMNELLEQGFDFDDAAQMIKEAGRVDAAKAAVGRAFGAAKAKGAAGVEAVKGAWANAGKNNAQRMEDGKEWVRRASGAKLTKNQKIGLGVGGALAAGGAGAYAMSEKKAAAMSELLEAGIDFDQAADMVKQASAELEDQFEKAAAVDHLVENGVDFDDAVELVKQAAEEIAAEEFGMAKAAALGELLEEGFDFDDALEMIKQASAGDMITEDGVYEGAVPNKNQVDNAQMHAEGASYIKPMLTSDGIRPTGTINEIFDTVIQDAISQGAASTDQVHETGVAQHEGEVEDHALPNQVKAAAMNELLEQGFDFDQAADMVKEAAEDEKYNKWRAAGRGALEGLAGNAILGNTAGFVASKLKAKPLAYAGSRFVGGLTGEVAGWKHGWSASKKKQLAEKKASTMKDLLEAGVDFEKAAQIVKEAGRVTEAVAAGKGMMSASRGKFNSMAGKARSILSNGSSKLDAYIKANPVKSGLIGTGAVGLAAVAPGGVLSNHSVYGNSEKKAEAMSLLLEQGVDFDQAAEMVKQASVKLGV